MSTSEAQSLAYIAYEHVGLPHPGEREAVCDADSFHIVYVGADGAQKGSEVVEQ